MGCTHPTTIEKMWGKFCPHCGEFIFEKIYKIAICSLMTMVRDFYVQTRKLKIPMTKKKKRSSRKRMQNRLKGRKR